jgi:hypothetical protein
MIRSIAIASVCLALVGYSALSIAGDFDKGGIIGTASVESGNYKPLTFWTTLTVGASYYTNPRRAQASSVAYAYEGPEFSEYPKNHSLWDLAATGKLSFGLVDEKSGSISVVDFSALKQKYSIKNPDDLTKVLERSDVKIVSSDKILLGERSKAPVIKTEPK